MSAECEKHGCDLVGHQFSEGGIRCPQCVLDAEIDRLRAALALIAHDRNLPYDNTAAIQYAQRVAREALGDGKPERLSSLFQIYGGW